MITQPQAEQSSCWVAWTPEALRYGARRSWPCVPRLSLSIGSSCPLSDFHTVHFQMEPSAARNNGCSYLSVCLCVYSWGLQSGWKEMILTQRLWWTSVVSVIKTRPLARRRHPSPTTKPPCLYSAHQLQMMFPPKLKNFVTSSMCFFVGRASVPQHTFCCCWKFHLHIWTFPDLFTATPDKYPMSHSGGNSDLMMWWQQDPTSLKSFFCCCFRRLLHFK